MACRAIRSRCRSRWSISAARNARTTTTSAPEPLPLDRFFADVEISLAGHPWGWGQTTLTDEVASAAAFDPEAVVAGLRRRAADVHRVNPAEVRIRVASNAVTPRRTRKGGDDKTRSRPAGFTQVLRAAMRFA